MHSSKSYAVHFKQSPDSVPVKQQTRLSSDDKDTVTLPHAAGILKGSKHSKESMYVIDPSVLNEEGCDIEQRSPLSSTKIHPYKSDTNSCVTDKPPVPVQTFSNTALKSTVKAVSSTSPHSNPTAVFGPPVSFGESRQLFTNRVRHQSSHPNIYSRQVTW